ncbi:uncharacterized protein [Solanum lycopersicum]|uniref:uncharacterized protein n=1 Tax=Solanum lycopersicum TaxID=4081 RepID=UPI00374826A9
MVDSKAVKSQLYELQLISQDLIAQDMVVNESFQVVAMIEKLPPSWNDFKNYPKHKCKEIKLEDLVIKKSNGQKSERVKKKFKGNYYNCGKAGHKSSYHRSPRNDNDKGKEKSQANTVEQIEDEDDLYVMVLDCNLVGNPKEWFLNSGVTRHICFAKEVFLRYTHVEFDEDLFLRNTTTTRIVGTRKVMLKMTSDKLSFHTHPSESSEILYSKKQLCFRAMRYQRCGNAPEKDSTVKYVLGLEGQTVRSEYYQ